MRQEHKAAIRLRSFRTRLSRGFQTWKVTTQFVFGGAALSASAIATLVGTTQALLASSMSTGGVDVFSYPWFDVGLGLGAIALAIGVVALASLLVQSQKRQVTPLEITTDSGVYCLETDSKTFSNLLVRVRNVSEFGLYDVRLKLVGGSDASGVRANFFLRSAHDNNFPFPLSLGGVTLPPHNFSYFQIANIAPSLQYMYADDGLTRRYLIEEPDIPSDDSFYLMLQAEGRRADDDSHVVAAYGYFAITRVGPGPGMLRLKRRKDGISPASFTESMKDE